MKTKYTVEKSEYSHCLHIFIGNASEFQKRQAYGRMKKIEKYIKEQGDEIIIVISTRDTWDDNETYAPSMTLEDIKKNKKDKD